MPHVSKTHYSPKDIDVQISEISDGIYRIAGFVPTYGTTFNQFLIDDRQPMLIHTGPIGIQVCQTLLSSLVCLSWI
jgi:hypothetical protein